MPHHDDTVPLRHMLDAESEAVRFSQGRTREDLNTHRLYQLAMVRLVEVVGEAASRVAAETRSKHPNVPWSQIVGARKRLIHGYDQIDLDILWDILQFDLPPLVQQLELILKPGPSSTS
jgi:uncharacterized protein with HEPN domain